MKKLQKKSLINIPIQNNFLSSNKDEIKKYKYLFVDDKNYLVLNYLQQYIPKENITIQSSYEEVVEEYKNKGYNILPIDILKIEKFLLPYSYDVIYTYIENLEYIYDYINFSRSNISFYGSQILDIPNLNTYSRNDFYDLLFTLESKNFYIIEYYNTTLRCIRIKNEETKNLFLNGE